MNDFMFYSPTKFHFGRGAAEKVGAELAYLDVTKALVHYGQGSVVKSGLLDTVKKSLEAAGIAYIELGGVRPNPEITLVREGIELCKKENIDFILCVGGGSVVDSAKGISAGTTYEEDVWDFYVTPKRPDGKRVLPLGVVLTIPAAGSEASSGSVLNNDAINQKSSFGMPELRPKVAFMDPELTFTLSPYQTAAGIVDMYAHLCERYFSETGTVALTDNIALALFKTVRSSAHRVLENPTDYEARANIMWAGTLCHNGIAGCGRVEDWVTHGLEHELSALKTEVTHGAGLAVMFPAWMAYVLDENPARFARYGQEVYGITPTGDSVADAKLAVQATKEFFASLNMPTTLTELGFVESDIDTLVKSLERIRGDKPFGSFKKLTLDDAREIYKQAL